MRKNVNLIICAVIAVMFLALPYSVLGYSNPDTVNEAPYRGDLGIEPRNVDDIINYLETEEDCVLLMNLDDYFPSGWSSITLSETENIIIEVVDEIGISFRDVVKISPNADWFGLESFSVTAWYNMGGIIQYPVIEYFTLEALAVNDPPVKLGDTPRFHMTADTTFQSALDLNDYFYDVDSNLEYSWTSWYGYASLEIKECMTRDSWIASVITAPGVEGGDLITITASDGEYEESCYMNIIIKPRETISMAEDSLLFVRLDEYISSKDQVISFEGNYVSVNIVTWPNGMVLAVFTPEANWFGEDTLCLQTYSQEWQIPIPTQDFIINDELISGPTPEPLSPPPGPVVPPEILPVPRPPDDGMGTCSPSPPSEPSDDWIKPPSIERFGYFEFDMIVENVNDPPKSVGFYPFPISLDEDETL